MLGGSRSIAEHRRDTRRVEGRSPTPKIFFSHAQPLSKKNISSIIGVVENGFSRIHKFAAIPSIPPMLTAGVVLERVIVGPHWLSACIGKKKDLPVLFTAHHSFRGKCEKSDFYSTCLSRLICGITTLYLFLLLFLRNKSHISQSSTNKPRTSCVTLTLSLFSSSPNPKDLGTTGGAPDMRMGHSFLSRSEERTWYPEGIIPRQGLLSFPILNQHSSIPNFPFPPKPWYTTRRAPTGADVSGNCFDHYQSMPEGN